MKLLDNIYRVSLWSVHYCIACCSVEIGASMSPFYDAERFGFLPMPSPRQADLIVLGGLLTHKMLIRFSRVYFQIPEPKKILAIGTCPLSGGVYRGSYSVIQNLPEIIPANFYVSGCPPRADAILEGVRNIRERWSELKIDEKEKRSKEKKLMEYALVKPKEIVIEEKDVRDFDLPVFDVELGDNAIFYKDIIGEHIYSIREVDEGVEIYVRASEIVDFSKILKEKVNGTWLSFITAVDYIDEKFFELIYSYWNNAKKHRVLVKTRIPREHPYISSIKDIWPSADFYEREIWEMFGIVFNGHRDLRYLLLNENWDNIPPLRKDFKIKI